MKSHLNKIPLLLVLFFRSMSILFAQVNVETYYDSKDTNKTVTPVIPAPVYDIKKISPVISFNNLFVRDYNLGFGIGAQHNKLLLQARLNFDFRPFFENVTFKENDTLNYQYKEKDYYLNLSFEKHFKFTDEFPSFRPYTQFNAGLLWGNFKGWNKSPEQRFAIAAGTGVFIAINRFFGIKLGYLYFKPLVLQTTPHRLCIQLQFNLYE